MVPASPGPAGSGAGSRYAEVGPVSRRTTCDAVVESIRRIIIFGLVPVGGKLPPERELSSTLGVGRRTLRAAIRRLADEGLLETRVGRSGGTWVRQPQLDRAQTAEYAKEARRALHASYEARLVVEPALARLAAERRDPESVRALVALAAERPDSVIEVRAVDSRIHDLIATMAGNDILRVASGRARADLFGWVDVLWMPFEGVSREESISRGQHIRIASAIEQGRGRDALSAMRHHLRWSLGTFERRMWPTG